MGPQETIARLKILKEYCEEQAKYEKAAWETEDSIWGDDAQALGIAIEAIEAVEKEMPRKVTKLYGTMFGECPNCGHTGLKQEVHEYCWWCGQKLDWEG